MQSISSRPRVTWDLEKSNQNAAKMDQKSQAKAAEIGKLILPGISPERGAIAVSRLTLKKKFCLAHKALIQSLSVNPIKKIVVTQNHTLKAIKINEAEKIEIWREGAKIIDYIYGLFTDARDLKISHFENSQGHRFSVKNIIEHLVKKYGNIPSTDTIKGISKLIKTVLKKNICYAETAWIGERQNVIKLASYYFNTHPDNQKVIELATYFFHTASENRSISNLVNFFLKNVSNTFLIESSEELFENVSDTEKNELAFEYFRKFSEKEKQARKSAIDSFKILNDASKVEIGIEYYKTLTENKDLKLGKNNFHLFFENQEMVTLALDYFGSQFKTPLEISNSEIIDHYFKTLPEFHRKKYHKKNDKFTYCLLEGIFPTQLMSNKLVLNSLMIPMQTLIGVYCLYKEFFSLKKILQISTSILERPEVPFHQKMNILNFISTLCKINLYPEEKLIPKVHDAFDALREQCKLFKIKEISRVFDEIQYYFYFQFIPSKNKKNKEDRCYSSEMHLNKIAEKGVNYKNFTNFVTGVADQLKLKSAKLISKLTVKSFFEIKPEENSEALEEKPEALEEKLDEISQATEFNNKIFQHFKNIYEKYKNVAASKDSNFFNKLFSSDSTKSSKNSDSRYSDLDLSSLTNSAPSADLVPSDGLLQSSDTSSGITGRSDSLHSIEVPSLSALNEIDIKASAPTRSASRSRFKIEVSPTRMNHSLKLSRVSSSSSSRSIDSQPRTPGSDSLTQSDSKSGRLSSNSSSPRSLDAAPRTQNTDFVHTAAKGGKICQNIIFFCISLAHRLAVEENDLFSSYAIFSVIQTDMSKKIKKLREARGDLKSKKNKFSGKDIEINEILAKLDELSGVLNENYNAKVQKCEKEKIFYLPPISKMKAAITGQIERKKHPNYASELSGVDFERVFNLSTIIIKLGTRLESIRLQTQKLKKPLLKSDIIKNISQVTLPAD